MAIDTPAAQGGDALRKIADMCHLAGNACNDAGRAEGFKAIERVAVAALSAPAPDIRGEVRMQRTISRLQKQVADLMASRDHFRKLAANPQPTIQAAPTEPVLHVNPEDLAAHRDDPIGLYLPARKAPDGKFTQALYTHAQATEPMAVGDPRNPFRHPLIHDGYVAGFNANLKAAPPGPNIDAERLGKKIAEYDGNVYTVHRGDTGEPEQWIKTSVRRLGHMAKRAIENLTVAPTEPAALTEAVQDVLAERRAQVQSKGYDASHDDEHVNDEIAAYAALYAMPEGARDWDASMQGYAETLGEALLPNDWTMPDFGDDRRVQLVKAGALILAEIERLDRAAARTPTGEQA